MGFFDDLIKQRDGEFIPVWQWVHDLAISHDSDIQAVIAHLQTTYKDLTVYRRDEKAVYTPKRKTGLIVYDERTIFESDLNTLKSYIDSFTGELNVYDLEHDTASNPTHTDYLKKSELPTFGEQAPSMAGVNDSNSPMNAGEIIAGLQTRILDLQRQQNATTANDDSQQQIADLRADNAKLKARIAELESQLNQQANATPANLKGLEKVNYDKAKAKLFAQIVAKSIWDMDTTEQIKSGDMVQYVKSLLLQFDDDSRPQTDEVISDWLRDIKPSYAKQSGRPSKNTPNEIPLTFKK